MTKRVSDTKYRGKIDRLLNRIFHRHDLQPPGFTPWMAYMLGFWAIGTAISYYLFLDPSVESKLRLKLAVIHSWSSFFIQPVDIKNPTALVIFGFYMLPIAGQFLGSSYASSRKGRYHSEAQRLAKSQGRIHPQEIIEKRGVILDGIPLGEYHGKRFGIKRGADAGHVLVIAPTRAGKGLHLTATLETWKGPAIIVDPKREQYQRTAGERARLGPIYVLPQHGIDILDFFKADDSLDLQELFTSLMQTWQDKEPIFAQKAFAVFEAARDTQEKTGEPMLRLLARWCNMSAAAFVKEADKYAPMAVDKFTDGEKEEINKFTLSSWGTFTAKFTGIAPHVETIARGDIPPQWAQDNATIYICYPLDQLEAAGGLLSVILTALMKGQQRQQKKNHTLFAIDEAPTAAIQGLDTKLATVGGYGITILAYVQQLSQLYDKYGQEAAKSIIGNFHHQIFFPTRDNESARYVAEKFGQELKATQSFGGGDGKTNYSQSMGPALESSQVNTLIETSTIVFTDNFATICQRTNPFTARKKPFAEPPPIVVGGMIYNSKGELVAAPREKRKEKEEEKEIPTPMQQDAAGQETKTEDPIDKKEEDEDAFLYF